MSDADAVARFVRESGADARVRSAGTWDAASGSSQACFATMSACVVAPAPIPPRASEAGTALSLTSGWRSRRHRWRCRGLEVPELAEMGLGIGNGL